MDPAMRRRFELLQELAGQQEEYWCAACGAAPKNKCTGGRHGTPRTPHGDRYNQWLDAGRQPAWAEYFDKEIGNAQS